MTAALIAYAFLILYGATSLPPAQFWLDINSVDAQGKSLNINNAFSLILRQGMGIMLGSIIAFLFGQILDALIFRKLRQLTTNKFLWIRATGSTLVSQLIDSFMVLFIAFFVFGNWPFSQIIAVASVNYIYKFIIAVLMTPFIYLIHYAIDKYLGKHESKEMIEKATYQ